MEIFGIKNENLLKHYYEPNPGLFIAESPKVIERALDAGFEAESFLVEEEVLTEEELSLLKRCKEAKLFSVNDKVKSEVTGYPMTRGMLAAMKRRELPSVESLCHNLRRIVILEEIENPTNLGAIFRSAAALGMEAVILTKGCTDPLYRRAARVSMGTVFQIPWTFMKDNECHWMDDTGLALKSMGFKMVSMALRNNTIDISDPLIKKEEKLAVIMGTEGEGLNFYTIDNSDYTVKIPMFNGVDSLNVASASAIAFWELA